MTNNDHQEPRHEEENNINILAHEEGVTVSRSSNRTRVCAEEDQGQRLEDEYVEDQSPLGGGNNDDNDDASLCEDEDNGMFRASHFHSRCQQSGEGNSRLSNRTRAPLTSLSRRAVSMIRILDEALAIVEEPDDNIDSMW